MKTVFRAIAALTILLACAGGALAQNWPNRPIRMIVPYTPGGYTDLMARLVGQKISDALGQPIIFENKPGANAIIGTDVVAKAAPDGYTFGTVIAAHAVNATLNPKLPYDTLKDFSYVSLMSVAPLIMIAHPSLPANNVQELIALAKAKPGELNFASSGVGAAAHLTMEMFKSRTGIDMLHISYKGTAGALQDVIGGRIDYFCTLSGTIKPQIESNLVNAVAVLTRERSPLLPTVASAAEQGLPDFEASTWFGLFVPKGTPAPVIQKLHDATVAAMDTPAVQERLSQAGATAVAPERRSAAYFQQFVGSEIEKNAKPIKAAGIALE